MRSSTFGVLGLVAAASCSNVIVKKQDTSTTSSHLNVPTIPLTIISSSISLPGVTISVHTVHTVPSGVLNSTTTDSTSTASVSSPVVITSTTQTGGTTLVGSQTSVVSASVTPSSSSSQSQTSSVPAATSKNSASQTTYGSYSAILAACLAAALL